MEHLDAIEARLTAIEARLAGIERRILSVGGGLVLLMRVDRFLEGGRGVSDDGTDCYQWTRRQTALLAERRWDQLDVEHLIEEVRSLGNEQAHAIESHLRNLLLHLLKWRYQPTRRTPSWRRSINHAQPEPAPGAGRLPRLAVPEGQAHGGGRDGAAARHLYRVLPVGGRARAGAGLLARGEGRITGEGGRGHVGIFQQHGRGR